MLESPTPGLSVARRRPLPYQASMALDVIVSMRSRSLPWHEFELRMHGRGCDGRACLTALACLERRNWAIRRGGYLSITDTGHVAAIKGANAEPSRSPTPRATHKRLPRGLFEG